MPGDRVNTGALQLLGGDGKCPVCGEPPRGNVWVCPACSAFHHQECRDYAGGCSTYGCRLAAPPPPDAVQKLPRKGRPISLLTVVAATMAAATFVLVGSLVHAFLQEREAEERLRAADRGPAIRFEGKDIDTVLGSLNISVDVRDDAGNVSVRVNGQKPSEVSSASFDFFGVKGRISVVSQ